MADKNIGKVAEWSIAPVLKTDVLRGTGGSNPSLSAANEEQRKLFLELFIYGNDRHKIPDGVSMSGMQQTNEGSSL